MSELHTDIYQRLLAAGIRFVSFRPRSEQEMRIFLQNKLTKWHIDDVREMDSVIDRLREYGYVDDQKFAQWWVEQRTSVRPKGTRAITQELRMKGVHKDIVEDLALIDDIEGAKAVVCKKASQLEKLPFIEQKRKIYGILGRRGFSGETQGRVIDEIAKFGYNRERKSRY